MLNLEYKWDILLYVSTFLDIGLSHDIYRTLLKKELKFLRLVKYNNKVCKIFLKIKVDGMIWYELGQSPEK